MYQCIHMPNVAVCIHSQKKKNKKKSCMYIICVHVAYTCSPGIFKGHEHKKFLCCGELRNELHVHVHAYRVLVQECYFVRTPETKQQCIGSAVQTCIYVSQKYMYLQTLPACFIIHSIHTIRISASCSCMSYQNRMLLRYHTSLTRSLNPASGMVCGGNTVYAALHAGTHLVVGWDIEGVLPFHDNLKVLSYRPKVIGV